MGAETHGVVDRSDARERLDRVTARAGRPSRRGRATRLSLRHWGSRRLTGGRGR